MGKRLQNFYYIGIVWIIDDHYMFWLQALLTCARILCVRCLIDEIWFAYATHTNTRAHTHANTHTPDTHISAETISDNAAQTLWITINRYRNILNEPNTRLHSFTQCNRQSTIAGRSFARCTVLILLWNFSWFVSRFARWISVAFFSKRMWIYVSISQRWNVRSGERERERER